ncbi:MAG TPA: hypothetical protein EYH03_03125 [Chromatiales bacterium]|nr:hypothetical protein [Chromatiales bacterium]
MNITNLPRNIPTGVAGLFGLLFLLLTTTVTTAAPYSLVIIPLHTRSAAEVIPMIQPFVGKDGVISGMRNQLVIRTSPQNMAEIRRILKEIDRPPRRLMIHVRQGHETEATQQEIRGGIDARTGRGRIRTGDGSNRVRGMYGRTRSDVDAQQHIQAVEGRPAFIATGTTYPVPRHTIIERNGIVYGAPGIGYRTTATGFFVRPQVVGDQVTLLISPRLERPGPQGGSFDYQSATTTVRGRLGEWIIIGGIGENLAQTQSGLMRRHSTTGHSSREISVKVMALD